MPSSGIIDLSVGIAFVFGVTAALSSVGTELIARFLGLRGAYLLLGLRELLDSKDAIINLSDAKTDFDKMTTLMKNAPAAPAAGAARPAAAGSGPDDPGSATGALLGSPILRSQGMTGQIFTRQLTLDKAGNNKNNRSPLPKSTGKGTWSLRRSLPSYIPARSFAEALIDTGWISVGSSAATAALAGSSRSSSSASSSRSRRSLGTPGAQFWFGLLTKLGSLRASGPPPAAPAS